MVDASRWEIPQYSKTELRPRSARYALCIPVINEGTRITTQLGKLGPFTDRVDVVIADGGSTDGSLVPDQLATLHVRTLLVKQGPGQLSAQIRMGLDYCLHQGYEGIILMDGNNKDDPKGIDEFVHALDEGFDHIQGSRFVPGGQAINTPWSRWLGIKLIHAPAISWAAGVSYTDTTNGFRAYSRGFLLDPRVAPFRNVFSKYELHYYLAIRAGRLGFRVKEVPVIRSYPTAGKVPTKITGVKGHLLILDTLRKACLGHYNPTEPPHA